MDVQVDLGIGLVSASGLRGLFLSCHSLGNITVKMQSTNCKRC